MKIVALALLVLVVVIGCTTITVLTGTGGGEVSSEADKGVIFKPREQIGSEKK